jgi:hypothetical protein
MRYLSRIEKDSLASIEALNASFVRWLDEDYQRRVHEGLGNISPLDAFLKQSDRIRMVEDVAAFNEAFLLRAHRTVKKDATFSFFGTLYECDLPYAGTKIEVRYEPCPNGDAPDVLFVFKDDKAVGTARVVNFTDNAHRRRKRPVGRALPTEDATGTADKECSTEKEHTICYRDQRGKDDV